ncbi:hypothetical protein ACFQYP_41025 [Nonomuraea antimicrobica]
MTLFLARRLAQALLQIWGAVTIVFVALRVLPGDPAELILGSQATLTNWPRSAPRWAWTGPCSCSTSPTWATCCAWSSASPGGRAAARWTPRWNGSAPR